MDHRGINLDWSKRIEYCHILGVRRNATQEKIKQAFRQQQRMHHPDKGGDEEKSKRINEAYHFLSQNPGFFSQTFNSQPSEDDDDTSSEELIFDSSSSDSDSSTQDDDNQKPRFVEQICEEITRARQETKTCFIVDNYFHCFSNILEELLSEKEAQRECSVFCKICDKSFINQDHHYRIQNIHQYIELLNSGSQMDFFFLLETKLGSDAWMWTPTVINPNDELMDFLKHNYDSIKDRVQDFLQLLQYATRKFESLKDEESLDLKPSFPQHTYREEMEIDTQSFELKECYEDGFAFPNGYLVELKQSSLPELIPQELLPQIKIFNGKPKTISTRLKTTCRNCRWKYNVLTKLFSCRMCGGIHCRRCQVKSVVLQLGYNSQVLICNKCAEQSKLENAELWATSAHTLLKGNKFQHCKLFLTVSNAYVKNSFQIAQKWKEVAELAFAKAQYGLFLQVQEYLYRNNSPDGLIATAKKLVSVSEGNLAAACLTDLKLSKDEWLKIAMEFSDLNSYSVAAFCISKAQLTEEESLQKSDEIMNSSGEREWEKAFLFLYKPQRNSMDWMKVAEVLLVKKQTKLAFESFRHLNETYLIKLCNRFGQRNEWENAMMCLLYLSQRLRLKTIPTEKVMLQYLLWVINKMNPEILLQNASLDITKKNYRDAFTVLAFLNFKWNFRNCWKRQSEIAFNKQNIDLAITLGILHHKESRVKDSWLLELGLKMKDFPHKACTCFLMGNYKLEYIAEIYKNKGNHEKCIEYYLKEKNLGKIRNIGQKLLSVEPHAAVLYYATVIKFLKGHFDSSYKMENLMYTVDELFSPDERKEVYKSFARSYPEVITQDIGVKIHLMLVQEIKQHILPEDDLKASELLHAAYHFLPLQLCEPVFSRKLKQNALKIQMKIAADEYDFHTLGNTLSQLTRQNLAIAKEIHDSLLGKKKLEELSSMKKAVLFILRGAILKINEQNLSALNHFLLAASTASHCLEEIAECIATLLHDFHFHENLIQGIFKEIEFLTNRMRRKSYIDLPYSMISTGILDRSFAGCVDINLDNSYENFLMLKWLRDVQSDTMDSVSLAYSCLKLYDSMHSNPARTSVLLTSATYFLQAIEKSTSLEDKYAYRNAIMKMGEMCTTAVNSVATPFFQTIVYQSIFALTISANQLCSLHLSEHVNATRNEKKVKRNLISEKKCQRIKYYLRSIMALGKVNPFINVRHFGLIDTFKMHIAGEVIMQEILKMKTSEQKFNSNLFPLHVYSYWKMIGIWQKWITDESVIFQSARYNCIKDLLEHKGWTMRQAEKVLEWPLINTNPDGWVNVMEKDLNLNPRVSFSGVGGFSMCLETGEVALLLEPCKNVSQALFTAEDVLEVFRCGGEFSFFALSDCLDEPLINYSPLAAGVYSPKSLKNTNLLKTMMKVDILLKELVTGMELNIQSPFLLRKTTEGILKRLPPQLKKEFEILYGNQRCSTGVSVSRFWMEMGATNLDIEFIKNTMIYKVGDITPSFKRYLMTQNDSGKYIDANPKNSDPDSVDEKFVKFLEKKYNEIGKYFPELLRLKQLQKISIICSCLKNHLFFHKNSGLEIDKKICASIKKLGVGENEENLMECTNQPQELYWIPTLYFQLCQESDSIRDTIKDTKIFGGISMRSSTQQGIVELSSLYKPYTVNSLRVFAEIAEIGRRNDEGEEQPFGEDNNMKDQGCGLETAAKQVLGDICSWTESENYKT